MESLFGDLENLPSTTAWRLLAPSFAFRSVTTNFFFKEVTSFSAWRAMASITCWISYMASTLACKVASRAAVASAWVLAASFNRPTRA